MGQLVEALVDHQLNGLDDIPATPANRISSGATSFLVPKLARQKARRARNLRRVLQTLPRPLYVSSTHTYGWEAASVRKQRVYRVDVALRDREWE